jgi:hypothetical protein
LRKRRLKAAGEAKTNRERDERGEMIAAASNRFEMSMDSPGLSLPWAGELDHLWPHHDLPYGQNIDRDFYSLIKIAHIERLIPRCRYERSLQEFLFAILLTWPSKCRTVVSL